MKQKRIFIENLPETVTESEIKSEFSKFGDVTSIQIKERKVVTIKNSSCFFAYINLNTDDSELQKCFQTFNETPWCGEYVKLQIAKESFLERLKRERETNSQTSEAKNINSQPSTQENSEFIATRLHEKPAISVENEKTTTHTSSKINEESTQSKPVKRKKKISSSSSDSSDEEENIVEKKGTKNLDTSWKNKEGAYNDIEIHLKKPNRGAKFVNGLLKIEDFGKGSIVDNRTKPNEKTLDKRQAEADFRRKNALMEKIKAYRQQKTAFDQFKKRPKIIRFDNDVEVEQNDEVHECNRNSSNKMTLFENSDSETDDLNIKKKIENRIKSDERFALDERFFEDEREELSNNEDEIDFIKEKQKESEILEEILGQKFKSKSKQNRDQTGPRYVRYDPSNPDHSKYELKEEQEIQKNSKKKKKMNEKKTEEKDAPEVSKERLHSVKVDLKAALGQNSGFSLYEIIGDTKEKVDRPVNEEETSLPIPTFSLMEKNPYKYDSSDNEDEPEHLEKKEKLPLTQKPKKVWTEPFFFQENDFRFQEGLDFVKRIATQIREEGEFESTRRQFKQIVKNKIRHAKKKSKPFQRKLGGSKKKKIKRMDNALKR